MAEPLGAGNQAEYAKHRKAHRLRGETEAAVSQAMSAGRLQSAIRKDGLIDFAIADKLWSAGRAPQVEFKRTEAEPATDHGAVFLRAKARRETAEADLAELKARKAQGDLVAVDEARKTWHAIGRMYAAARENVPMQLAPKLVGKTDLGEIESLIRTFYREADAHVADEIHARFSQITGSDGDNNNPGLDAHS